MTIEEMKRGMTLERFRDPRGVVVRHRLCLFAERVEDPRYPERTDDELMRAGLIADIFQEVREELTAILHDRDLNDSIQDSRRRLAGEDGLQRIRALRDSLT